MKAKTWSSLALALVLPAAAAHATTLPAAFPENKFSALGLPSLPHDRYEASGVHYQDGYLYVVFDNSYRILKSNAALTSFAMPASTFSPDTDSQFEAITFDARGTTHFYVAAETSATGKINEFNASLSSRNVQPINGATTFTHTNTEYEGLAWLWHCSLSDPNGDDYLLALCEGNGCTGGSSGNGRVQVLRQTSSTSPTSWTAIPGGPIALPSTANFGDYADIALAPAYPATCDCAGVCSNATGRYKVAVVSQESSKLWIGVLDTTNWSFSSGTVYDFPTDGDGNQYCNVEGVTFLPNNKIAVVSDAKKQDQGAECVAKEQTISIFTLPS